MTCHILIGVPVIAISKTINTSSQVGNVMTDHFSNAKTALLQRGAG
jgi:hypothetical protein